MLQVLQKHSRSVLLHCFIMYLCCLLPLRDYYPTVMARYSLFVLKVPLNSKQTNKQTMTFVVVTVLAVVVLVVVVLVVVVAVSYFAV